MLLRCPQCGAQYRVPEDRIKAASRVRCPKCNATFSVGPKSPEAPIPARPPGFSAPESGAAAERRRKVVIVEDARFFRELIRDVLQPLDLDVSEAADGVAGLALILRERPDLAILDLNLPGMNGYDLMRAVRAESQLRHTRLLAMSGVYRKEPDQVEAEAAGADDFIGKSFTPDFLLERVRRLLGLSS